LAIVWESVKSKDDGKFEGVWCRNEVFVAMVVEKPKRETL
jgi:hypothetical protein